MGFFRGVPKWVRYSLVLGILFTFVLSLALFLVTNFYNMGGEAVETGARVESRVNHAGNTRKTLVVGKKDVDNLRFQVRELEEIRASVRNELRLLEHRQLQLSQDLEGQREALLQVKKELLSAKIELQNTRDKTLRAIRHENGNFVPPTHPSHNPAPVVILPAKQTSTRLETLPPIELTEDQFRQCSYSLCFDHSRCPVTQPFLVYVYSEIFFNLKHPRLVSNFVASLQGKGSYTLDPSKACIFVAIVGPLSDTDGRLSSRDIEEKIHSLPHWKGDGYNHVLIDVSDHEDVATLSSRISVRRAIITQSHLSPITSTYRRNYDILAPPVTLSSTEPIWKGFPPYLPAVRPILLYFEGRYLRQKEASDDASCVSADDLKLLEKAVGGHESVYIQTDCAVSGGVDEAMDGEWELCRTAENRTSLCAESTFALVLGGGAGKSGKATYTRLIEALHCGAIPVILGAEVSTLPFSTVVNWHKAAVILPCGRFPEAHFIIRSFDHNTILDYRRQGRFLWATYFSSLERILDAVVSIVRSNTHHPPPLAPEYTGKKVLSLSGSHISIRSPTYQYNFSLYTERLWNSPPGPFYMYSVTPYKSPPVSGTQYVNMKTSAVAALPPHILQGAGITGPFFEKYLLGNVPDEQFTVIMLTYQRNEVLIQALERLQDLAFLNKVVVVWNNPEELPTGLPWPKIGVPIEVIQPEQNSLNNRFLPFASIETEAVLSIDDDVHLRQDEIQFAFRVWREARERIVGFPGRFHNWDIKNGGWLYNSNYTCELSMVLTGAAFFHKYYSYLYSYWMPQEIRDIVDQYMNCEDIAMNFLVSHITRQPPLKVTTRWTFHCPSCPESLSSRVEHFNERHVCLNKFTEVYGYMPLLYTQFRLDSVLFKTRIPSTLEKCYSYI